MRYFRSRVIVTCPFRARVRVRLGMAFTIFELGLGKLW